MPITRPGLLRGSALALGIAGLLAAAGARRPVIRRWPLSIIQAAPSFLASETPGALAGVHVAAAATALFGRGPRSTVISRVGVLAAVVNGMAVAALADLQRDAVRSARVLGAVTGPVAGRQDGCTRAAPRGAHRRGTDIAYGGHPAQRLDVWARPDLPPPAAAAPVLLQVHGGGWTGGDKARQAGPLLRRLAERGWVCVTINYRLGPAELWPAMIVDVKAAIAWVRSNIAAYGGDPDFVAVTGGSAGGHLAALAALSPNDPAFQPGFAEVDTTLAAAVTLYGVYDFTVDEHGLFALLEGKVLGTTLRADGRAWRAASPVHRAGAHAPPFLVIHGSADTVSGVGQSRRLVARLREVSREAVRYAELPRAQHGFDAWATARTRHTVEAVDRFLTEVHERHRADRQAATGPSPETPATSS